LLENIFISFDGIMLVYCAMVEGHRRWGHLKTCRLAEFRLNKYQMRCESAWNRHPAGPG